jgi:very-short-patch-repair endonuclease
MEGKLGRNQYQKARDLGLPKPILSEESRKKISEKTTINNMNRHSEVNEKISKGMKKAHAEGRAWNIGKSRWNNELSYPEKFFTEVIENEFKDKEYKNEFPIGIYSADFCWPHLKKVIEIDGDQHQRFEEYIERDKRKDEFLTSRGYQILRIIWKEMFNNTKEKIKECYEFIHSK